MSLPCKMVNRFGTILQGRYRRYLRYTCTKSSVAALSRARTLTLPKPSMVQTTMMLCKLPRVRISGGRVGSVLHSAVSHSESTDLQVLCV